MAIRATSAYLPILPHKGAYCRPWGGEEFIVVVDSRSFLPAVYNFKLEVLDQI